MLMNIPYRPNLFEQLALTMLLGPWLIKLRSSFVHTVIFLIRVDQILLKGQGWRTELGYSYTIE